MANFQLRYVGSVKKKPVGLYILTGKALFTTLIFHLVKQLHIQTIRIQQEVIHTDNQDAVIGIPGSRSIFDHDDFLEGVIDAEQRVGFLLHFCFVRDGESRLDIIALGTLVAHKVYFQLLADIFACTVFSIDAHQPHIHTKVSCNQFIEQDILHGMVFFDLTEIDPGVSQAYIAEIILLGVSMYFLPLMS